MKYLASAIFSHMLLKVKNKMNIGQNMDEEWISSRRTTKWVRTQYQGAFAIFGALRVAEIIMERYIMKNIGGSYHVLRYYYIANYNNIYVGKVIRNYPDE